ncbi:hypothetical protein BDF14DRAFT_1997469 [Spinellus fusiger]|nr:hypothetical protein BDF14DRAFT_1997469 [Spinellus fusiger]
MSKPIVLVTGCTEGGIGYDLCKKFVKEGCNVFAAVRKAKSAGDLTEHGCTIVEIDVSNKDSVKNAVNNIIERVGHIDVLVNNSGCAAQGALLDIEDEVIGRCIDTNILGLLYMCRAVGYHMARRNKGTIVNIGSILGYAAIPWAGIYSMSKAAVHSLTDALRLELKPFGVNVVLVAPGAVASRFLDNSAPYINIPDDFAKYIVPRVLRKSPSSYITYGSYSFSGLILYYIPVSLRDFLLRKNFGLGNA